MWCEVLTIILFNCPTL